jgi:hypothetical protein
MSIADQIADLGSQFEAAILNAYTSIPTGGLEAFSGQPLLAFLPGDIPVPVDTFVQSTGTGPPAVNPLLVSMWLKSDAAGADTPLLIQTNQTTVVTGPPGGFTTMSEVYFDLLSFAQPLAAVGSPEANIIAQELIWARETLPQSPDLMTLVTQPSDWALPSSNYWTEFSYTTTPPTQPPGTPVSPPIFVPPSNIWRLRSVVPPTSRPGNHPVLHPMATVASAAARPAPAVTAPIAASIHPDFLIDLNAVTAAAPAVTAPATQVSIEHTLISIDRSSWWQNDWLVDPGWYVPGEPRGTAVSPTSSAEQTWAIPMAMVLVQNLVLTGSWSASDASQLTSNGVMFGPFHLGGAAVSTNANETLSITVAGPSLVAFFCQPLVVLPPSDPPMATSGTPAANTTPTSGAQQPSTSTAAQQPSGATSAAASATPGSGQSS